MADQRATAAPREATGIYADFDAFKKQAIRDYYERGWTSRRGNFIALLIAAGGGASLGLAKDSVVDGTGTKKVAIGAGLALALRVGLRYALGLGTTLRAVADPTGVHTDPAMKPLDITFHEIGLHVGSGLRF